MELVRTKGLSSSELKWFALVLIVLDHIHYMFAYISSVVRSCGAEQTARPLSR